MKALIEQSGATFSTSVTEACTHLVTTQTDVDKKSTKCEYPSRFVHPYLLINRSDKKASGLPDCQIVSLDWLLESGNAKRLLPESMYAFDKESTGQVSQNQNNGNGDTEKKAKDVKPAKKRNASEEEAPDSKKKIKDSQKATTKSLHIPLDEGFDLRDGYYKSKFAEERIRGRHLQDYGRLTSIHRPYRVH